MELASWRTHFKLPHDCLEINFWAALEVWNKSPNLINKRIFGVNLFDLGFHDDLMLFNEALAEVSLETNHDNISIYLNNKSRCVKRKELFVDSEGPSENSRYRTFAKVILFKRTEPNGLELTLFDNKEKSVIFYQPSTCDKSHFSYAIKFKEESVELDIPSDVLLTKEFEWYCNILLPKLKKWMSNYSSVHKSSIALVPIDQYKILYGTLKSKYGSDIRKIWTEVTDPDKFIHEDIAIATYLLLLWKGKRQKYVDLGCGNGLLVHILNGESHDGIGYDLRARKIWEKYPPSTVLKVEPIKPSKEQVFNDPDWIIGNHSDELTPWIPVIATFSSPHCNFFLLPCCAYEFDGSKFKRNNSAKSLYNDYLDYVEKVCVLCGFQVKKDRLRIPSTKRICYVSEGRSHGIDEYDKVKQSIDKFIEESSHSKQNKSAENWNIEIKLRESKEKVRNCTQLDQILKENIVNQISWILLQENSLNENNWNEGKPTRIEHIIKSLASNLLKQLKNEGKGLQTFIKNHHHVFKLENGFVSFRKPCVSNSKSENWKKKTCWFYENHPDSCPLEDVNCSYKHCKS